MNKKDYFKQKNINQSSENISINKTGFSWIYKDFDKNYIGEKIVKFSSGNKRQYWKQSGLNNPPFNMCSVRDLYKTMFFVCEGESDTETIVQNSKYPVIGISGWAALPNKQQKLEKSIYWKKLNFLIWVNYLTPICLFDRDIFNNLDKRNHAMYSVWFIKGKMLNWNALDIITDNKYKKCKDVNQLWCQINDKIEFNELLVNIVNNCCNTPNFL